jgi:hypothetical protein
MSSGYASALEIAARIIRENGNDHTTARRLIAERLHQADESVAHAEDSVKALEAAIAKAREGVVV